ncbi:MAG: hypothetical protein BTN85_0893 [Candidatus Methanohalarchaeum thermophilum]|uniref:Uncharacterized protein n=1 Tax=Methanohalarchaeum thermophilum TaxID=1903181 RepID=A0A1Q6DVR3_METT1|nr:MAG: hypothetical protein BTN85_0893 [Candidatus Methanohalarchaeum thermophilum]
MGDVMGFWGFDFLLAVDGGEGACGSAN